MKKDDEPKEPETNSAVRSANLVLRAGLGADAPLLILARVLHRTLDTAPMAVMGFLIGFVFSLWSISIVGREEQKEATNATGRALLRGLFSIWLLFILTIVLLGN